MYLLRIYFFNYIIRLCLDNLLFDLPLKCHFNLTMMQQVYNMQVVVVVPRVTRRGLANTFF